MCTRSTAFSASACGHQRVPLQKWPVCCFSCLVCSCSGRWFQGPGSCRAHTGPSSAEDPRGAPGGPVSSLHNCQETDTCALSGGTCSNLVSSAWTFPAPRSPNSFLTPALKGTGWIFLSPPRTPAPDFHATVSFMIVISPCVFFFFW